MVGSFADAHIDHGGGGVEGQDHSLLNNLDYAGAGHTGFEASVNKAVANGYCDLDANIKVPLARLPWDNVIENFTPLDLPGMGIPLHFWFRANQGITKNGSDIVTQWDDYSGNARHLIVSDVAYGPTWVDAVVNGKPGVYFDGVDKFMYWYNSTGWEWGYTTKPRMAILVFRYSGGLTEDRTLLCFNIGSGTQHFRVGWQSNVFGMGWQWYPTGATGAQSAQFPWSSAASGLLNPDFILTLAQSQRGSEFTLRESGRTLYDTHFFNQATSPFWKYLTFGCRSYNGLTTKTSFFKGYLLEAIVCDCPNQTIISLIEQYAANRYKPSGFSTANLTPLTYEGVGTNWIYNGSYTITEFDGLMWAVCTSADVTITLPSFSQINSTGRSYTIIRVTAANAYKVRVQATASTYLNGVLAGYFDLMEGNESVTISARYYGEWVITRTSPETLRKISAIVAGASTKNPPIDADTFPIVDSADSNQIKQLSWTNTKATLKTYFDTLYAPIQAFGNEAFDAGKFTASGSMTWTVAAGDVTTYRYMISGKMMTVWFDIATSTVGGTLSTGLYIQIPASQTAGAKDMCSSCGISDNGVFEVGHACISAGDTKIAIYRGAVGNFTASTDNTRIFGQITFEIV